MRERREAQFVTHTHELFAAYLEFVLIHSIDVTKHQKYVDMIYLLMLDRFFDKGLRSLSDLLPARDTVDAAVEAVGIVSIYSGLCCSMLC